MNKFCVNCNKFSLTVSYRNSITHESQAVYYCIRCHKSWEFNPSCFKLITSSYAKELLCIKCGGKDNLGQVRIENEEYFACMDCGCKFSEKEFALYKRSKTQFNACMYCKSMNVEREYHCNSPVILADCASCDSVWFEIPTIPQNIVISCLKCRRATSHQASRLFPSSVFICKHCNFSKKIFWVNDQVICPNHCASALIWKNGKVFTCLSCNLKFGFSSCLTRIEKYSETKLNKLGSKVTAYLSNPCKLYIPQSYPEYTTKTISYDIGFFDVVDEDTSF